MELDFRHNLQPTGFSVHVLRANGDADTVLHNVRAKDAALGFWHYANNFSAKSGLTNRVTIIDTMGSPLLTWVFGSGYSFDNGKTFSDKPILMDS